LLACQYKETRVATSYFYVDFCDVSSVCAAAEETRETYIKTLVLLAEKVQIKIFTSIDTADEEN
jgi:hypothetical protein